MRWRYLGELRTFERDSNAIQDAVGWDLRSVRVDRIEELEFRSKRGLGVWEMAVSLGCKSPRVAPDGNEGSVPQGHYFAGDVRKADGRWCPKRQGGGF